MCARWVRLKGAHPLIARLRQHAARPNHPNYSQLGFRVHPPNPPQGGGFLLYASPRSSAENVRFTAKRAEMGRSTKGRAPNKHCASRTLSGLLESRASRQLPVGRAGRFAGSLPRTGPEGAGALDSADGPGPLESARPPGQTQKSSTDHAHGRGFGGSRQFRV